MNSQKIGENIRRERMKKLMTQSELAQMANVAIGTICNAERGRRVPQNYTLRAIADALGVPTATLTRGAV